MHTIKLYYFSDLTKGIIGLFLKLLREELFLIYIFNKGGR